MVFGADLNPPLPSPPLPLPQIVEPTTTFDLSGMAPYHEVCIALLVASYPPAGHYTYFITFYNWDTRTLLHTQTIEQDMPANSIGGGFSWIGYVPWEIWRNGQHRVDFDVLGPETFRREIYFDVVGVPPPPPPPAPPGENVFDSLRNAAILVTNVLVTAALDANASVILRPLTGLLSALSTYTSHVAGYLFDASRWYNEVTAAITRALSWDGIRAAILEWLPWLPAAAAIIPNWDVYVWNFVRMGWDFFKREVLGWLGAARAEVLEWLTHYVSWQAIGDWYEARLDFVRVLIRQAEEGLLDAIEAVAAPIRAEVNRHSAVIELLTDPGDAALRWLQERIERMIVRLW